MLGTDRHGLCTQLHMCDVCPNTTVSGNGKAGRDTRTNRNLLLAVETTFGNSFCAQCADTLINMTGRFVS